MNVRPIAIASVVFALLCVGCRSDDALFSHHANTTAYQYRPDTTPAQREAYSAQNHEYRQRVGHAHRVSCFYGSCKS